MFSGACHCGSLRVRFEPSGPADELALRACDCTFCRKHAVTTVADPEGRLEITIVDPEEAVRYRFGARTADFLLCGRCGVYVAAVIATSSGAVATLNINVLDRRGEFTQIPVTVSYEDETREQRLRRRSESWMLTSVVLQSEPA